MRENYDDEMLKQINDNANLLDYVSQSMELEPRNGEYWAHCPFHQDLTPSLSFSPEKNSYYCFSCGRSGRTIGYLMTFEKMKFDDAVEKAAKLANLDLSKMCHSKTISFLKRIKTMLMKPKDSYEHPELDDKELLKYHNQAVQEWLDEGIQQDVMDLFGVLVDTWGNRIVYPVYDIYGKLINIKGRTRYKNFKQMKIPKYINYFEVGVMDYFQGLNITLSHVVESNEIIIFESIKSVMKAYGWGYKNCASAEKHMLTDEQIDLLVKLRVNVVFAYDSEISYWDKEVKDNIDKLKRVTNVYIIEDRKKLLGGPQTKNAPVDCGKEIWEELYSQKRKIT